MKTTVFLGGGRITGAICAGLRLAGDRRTIVVYDRHPEKLRELRRESQVEIARDLKPAVERAEMLIVAVRPGSVVALLEEIAESGAVLPRLFVSLAAGIPLSRLKQLRTPREHRRTRRSRTGMSAPHWARAMPSPVCRIGKGLTPLCFDRDVTASEQRSVTQMFEQVGPVQLLPEHHFDAITASHSPTHGYHAVAALAKAARAAGLDQKTALIAAAHALGEGIAYWLQSGSSLDELLEEAATPGGIAAATMAAMDRAGYGRVVREGIKAGVRQARKNARK